MDDGLGFSIGALLGGALYQNYGGRQSFRIFAIFALITCIAHFFLRPAATNEIRVKEVTTNDNEKTANDLKPKEEKPLTEKQADAV